MRRSEPRAITGAVEAVAGRAAPATTLARVQGVWTQAAGTAVAREAEPVSEREGVVTVACRSGVWAHELELLAAELTQRLDAALRGPDEPRRVRELRFVVGSHRERL